MADNYTVTVQYTVIMGAVSAVLLILVTLFYLFINICLTILGYLPGHIHAFYLEWVYYDRREQAREGRFATGPAPGVYSSNVQTGGQGQGYGTIAHPSAHPPPHAAPGTY
ncbi:RIC1 [Paramyrothecium foliicola]|nr:RIC1 [Paramyrothecium foliicola]